MRRESLPYNFPATAATSGSGINRRRESLPTPDSLRLWWNEEYKPELNITSMAPPPLSRAATKKDKKGSAGGSVQVAAATSSDSDASSAAIMNSDKENVMISSTRILKSVGSNYE